MDGRKKVTSKDPFQVYARDLKKNYEWINAEWKENNGIYVKIGTCSTIIEAWNSSLIDN